MKYFILGFFTSLILVIPSFGSDYLKKTPSGELLYYNQMLVGSFMLLNDTDEFIVFAFTGKLTLRVSGYQSAHPRLEDKSVSTDVDVTFLPIRINKNKSVKEEDLSYLKSPITDLIVPNTYSGCFKAALFLPSAAFHVRGDIVAIECQDIAFIECGKGWESDIESPF
jgi:hypothetical protein